MKYRKKPIEVEAWQILTFPMPDWAENCVKVITFSDDTWLVKEPNGELSMLSDATFRKEYEAVE